jgi:hypothetical protein
MKACASHKPAAAHHVGDEAVARNADAACKDARQIDGPTPERRALRNAAESGTPGLPHTR